MPDETREFSHFWRTPHWEDELQAQNEILDRVLERAQGDLPHAKNAVEEILAVLDAGWQGVPFGDRLFRNAPANPRLQREFQLMAQNMLARMQLVQLLAYFEGVNELARVLGIPQHGYTLTPNAIRDALEMLPRIVPLDTLLEGQ